MRVADEDVAHGVSSHREEVGAALVPYLIEVDELQIGFVDERRRIQRMASALVHQSPMGNAPQLVIDDGEEMIEGGTVPFRECTKQAGDVPLIGRRQRLNLPRAGRHAG
jgi:hypothetical protein